MRRGLGREQEQPRIAGVGAEPKPDIGGQVLGAMSSVKFGRFSANGRSSAVPAHSAVARRRWLDGPDCLHATTTAQSFVSAAVDETDASAFVAMSRRSCCEYSLVPTMQLAALPQPTDAMTAARERRRRIRFMAVLRLKGLKRLKRLKGLKRLKRNFRSSLSSCNSRPRRIFYGRVRMEPRGRDWSGRGEPRSFQFHRAQNSCNHPLWKWRFTSKSRTVESTPRPSRTPREVLALRSLRSLRA